MPFIIGKVIPVQFWTGPEGSRKLGPQISWQSAHESGKGNFRTGRPNSPGNIPGTDFCYRLILAKDYIAAGRIMSMKNFVTFRLLAQRLKQLRHRVTHLLQL